MRGLYGKVLPEVIRADRATKKRGLCDKNRRQYFPVQTEQTRLIRDLLYGFDGSKFVLTVRKDQKTLFLACFCCSVLFGVIFALKRRIWVICFSRIVKLTRRVFFVVTVRYNEL